LNSGLPSAIAPLETREMTQPPCGAKGENDRAGRDRYAALFEDRLHSWTTTYPGPRPQQGSHAVYALKQSKRTAGPGRVTKKSPEAKARRKKVDSKKTGVRKTRKQRDVRNKGTPSRSVRKSPRRTARSASARPAEAAPVGAEYLPGDPRSETPAE